MRLRPAAMVIAVALTALALLAGTAAPARGELTDAEYRQHVTGLRRTHDLSGFTVVRAGPFVVIGNEGADRVEHRAKHTVGWAVSRLKERYFQRDPNHFIDVFLLKDRESYVRQCKRIFGREPHTPYGFYSAHRRTMLMNIATGGGTLVHEIVHPYVAANFPDCPAWFNEGLGSLYEQAAERDGRIVGLTNWRLAHLQKMIRHDKLPTFRALCSTTSHEFYEMDRGLHYAQARYLCYYLQQQGKLQGYYRSFAANVEDDPTGFRTLKDILGERDMAAFQRRWEKWVLSLRFPPSR